MIFRLGELFCGPGGLAWGALNANIKNKVQNFKIVHQWATDYNASTCDTYRHNICPENPDSVYQEDVRKLDMHKLAPIDALAFGFPCDDFSVWRFWHTFERVHTYCKADSLYRRIPY